MPKRNFDRDSNHISHDGGGFGGTGDSSHEHRTPSVSERNEKSTYSRDPSQTFKPLPDKNGR